MNYLPSSRLLGLASLGVILSVPSLAQDTSHYYGGLSVGQSKTEINPHDLTSGMLPGVSAVRSKTDEKDTAYKLFGGYQFNRNLAVEGGYFNLGKNRLSALTAPPGALNGQTRVEGLNLDLVGTLPLSERFAALARVGAQHAWSQSRFTGSGAAAGVTPNRKMNASGYKVGLGMQYEVNPSMWLRGEVERYRIKDVVGRRNNVDLLSVSLVFPFGRASAQRVAAAPVYVAPTTPMPVLSPPVVIQVPAPAPVVVVPARERVNLSADALFGSNQHTLRAQGQADLTRFGQQLSGATYDTITVEGHTDRMGSTQANQRLSEARAASVKEYLVIQERIDPARISATGKSENSPVTAVTDCSDSLPRAQLIECLQPDRRVEIEVNGTR